MVIYGLSLVLSLLQRFLGRWHFSQHLSFQTLILSGYTYDLARHVAVQNYISKFLQKCTSTAIKMNVCESDFSNVAVGEQSRHVIKTKNRNRSII